ncbi:MAG: asparagine synthase-related protein, partial [Gemmatimonadaceae bacterium]
LGVVQRVQYMDVMTYLPNDILTKVDIASMAHGLETRTPLIDVDLWNLLTQMPERVYVGVDPFGELSGKHVLKRFLSRWFPDRFLHRKKQGFAVPLARWFAADGDARALVEDRLLGRNSNIRSLLDPTPVRDLLAQGRTGPVWVLLVLEEWMRQAAERSASTPTVSLHSERIDIFPTKMEAKKPRILAIADVPNWIFERHAKYLQEQLADDFNITVQFHTQQFDEDDYDLIYPLEFGLVPTSRITQPWKYVTALRSHVSWQSHAPEQLGGYLNAYFQRTHVVSERLRNEIAPFVPRIAYVTHGIDGTIFAEQPRSHTPGKKLRVGWAGNRQTAVKGFDEYIKPLGDLAGVELVFCGYSDRNLGLNEMAQWYRSIDVYVCASLSEGSNNSLIEAAATGCAIVTTDNGTVPEYLHDGVEALVVNREPQAFIDAVSTLRDNLELRLQLGRAAAKAVHPAWTWQVKAEEYRQFFQEALDSRADARRRMATTTPAGQQWMRALIERVQRNMTRGNPTEAIVAIDELLDADGGNEGFRQVRAQLVTMQSKVAAVA